MKMATRGAAWGWPSVRGGDSGGAASDVGGVAGAAGDSASSDCSATSAVAAEHLRQVQDSCQLKNIQGWWT